MNFLYVYLFNVDLLIKDMRLASVLYGSPDLRLGDPVQVFSHLLDTESFNPFHMVLGGKLVSAINTAHTWVFLLRWSIRATARRPEESWLFTSKMQLLSEKGKLEARV